MLLAAVGSPMEAEGGPKMTTTTMKSTYIAADFIAADYIHRS